MASWERYAFAILRGGVKGIPLAGGVIEEVLRVLDDTAGLDATGIVARRADAQSAKDLSPEQQLELEDLAKKAARTLSGEDQADLKVVAERLAAERDPGRRREQARLLAAKLTRGVLEHGELRDLLAAAGAEAGLGQGALVAGKYRLLERLGKGGFGTVWRARHELLRQDVAVKLMNPEVAQDEEARLRFLKEVQTTTSFVHERAVQLRDFGQEPGGQLYFTMDLIRGRTLREVLDQEGRLAPSRVVRLGVQALEVLQRAHEAGIVHRDLKPQNLIVTTGRDGQEEIRVLDFGIAKAMSSAQKNTSGLTLTGMTVGTLRYMSPEQVRGKKLDGRSDLYSLGAVLYEALSGCLPIEADPDAEDTRRSLEFKLATDEAVDLAEVAPQVPAELRQVIMQALAKTPDGRFAEADAFRAALLATQATSPGPLPAADDTASFMVTNPRPVAGVDTASRQATDERASRSGGRDDPTTSGQPTGPLAAAPDPAQRSTPHPPPPPRRSRVPVAMLSLVALAGGALALDLGGVRSALLAESVQPAPEQVSTSAAPSGPPLATIGPTVTITEPTGPAEGGSALVNRDVVRVAGRVAGDLRADALEVQVSGLVTPLRADGTFQATLRLAEGSHDLVVVATGRTPAGPVEGRATRPIVVDLTGPVLRITGPTDGSTTTDEQITLQASVADASPWVDVTLTATGATTIAPRTVRVPRSKALSEGVALSAGETTLALASVDAAGNRGSEVRVQVRRELAMGLTRLPPGVSAGQRQGEWVHDKTGIVLVWVPPGTFRMGSDGGDSDEKPVHEVRIRGGYFLGKTEVTWGQFGAFCRATSRAMPPIPSFAKTDQHPVVNVSWDDAAAYCQWATLRLPTEVEWEYAARGTDDRTYPWGNEDPDAARCNLSGEDDGFANTAPVGLFPKGASPVGALDMAGNVWEWVQDWYGPYPGGVQTNSTGATSGAYRANRGGSWGGDMRTCLAANRTGDTPDSRSIVLGFRVALSSPQ